MLLSPEITYWWEPMLCHGRKATSRASNGLALRSRRGMEPVEGKMERALNLVAIQTRLHRIAGLVSNNRPVGVRRSAVAQRTRVPEESDAGIPHVRI